NVDLTRQFDEVVGALNFSRFKNRIALPFRIVRNKFVALGRAPIFISDQLDFTSTPVEKIRVEISGHLECIGHVLKLHRQRHGNTSQILGSDIKVSKGSVENGLTHAYPASAGSSSSSVIILISYLGESVSTNSLNSDEIVPIS